MTGELVPFGKHKGKPVETLLADPGYAEWIMGQPWFRDRYPAIYQTIINYNGEPADTPEHNQMQAAFLDDSWCLTLARRLYVDALFDGTEASRVFAQATHKDEHRSYTHHKASQLFEQFGQHVTRTVAEPVVHSREFEVNGWDVVYSFRAPGLYLALTSLPECVCVCDHDRDCSDGASCRGGDLEYRCNHRQQGRVAPLFESWQAAPKAEKQRLLRDFQSYSHCSDECPWNDGIAARWLLDDWERLYAPDTRTVRVECKPDLGDDFPAVLRQVTRYERGGMDTVVVLARRHRFEHVTWDQVSQIFAASKVVLVNEELLDAEMEPAA
jgi:hypothetical protein